MFRETYPERPQGYPVLKEELLLGYFIKLMKGKYKVIVAKKYIEVIEDMIYGILTAQRGELTVIPAFMGLGKSSLLMVFIKVMATIDPSFGCIVVKERIEDMLALEEQLGYVDDQYGEQKIAYAIHSFHQSICYKHYKKYESGMCRKCDVSICRVKSSFEEQYKYPVAIITHERLFREANTEEMINHLKIWKDEKGNKRERQYIFIDERPKFFTTQKENWATFDILVNQLERIASLSNKSIDLEMIKEKGYKRFSSIKNNEARLFHEAEVLSKLREMDEVWWKHCPEEHQKLFPMYKDFFSNGGYNNNGFLMTYQYTDYTFKDYATVILDGTAKGDMIYPDSSRFIGIEDFRTYENLTVYHCEEFNLSKTKLEDDSDKGGLSKEKKLSILIPEINEISQSGKTLVLCAEENEEAISELLAGVSNVAIAHFNAVKGSNKYLGCTNIFFAGTMDFGDGYYILKALAINADNVDTFETHNTDRQHLFKSDFINQVERNDKERYILQDIFRTAIRKVDNKEPVNVYLFQTDKELVRLIAESLKGSTVKIWTPVQYRIQVAPRETQILEYLKSNLVNIGDEIRKSQLEKDLGISKDVRKETFKRKRVQQFLLDNGIENSGQKLIKIK